MFVFIHTLQGKRIGNVWFDRLNPVGLQFWLARIFSPEGSELHLDDEWAKSKAEAFEIVEAAYARKRPLPHHSVAALGAEAQVALAGGQHNYQLTMSKIIDKLELPEEISLAEAAEVLGVSLRTAKRYIDDGLLLARNIAPPRSAKAQYRLPLSAVLELRTGYTVQMRQPRVSKSRPRAKRYEPKTMKRVKRS